ncbi:MAG TPA: peptidoglycan-binding domain-containing protein [Pyrinomonadaceae bacterium]|nr:peptidoglycan-binding domain-containing protein [Pyrinomonadaceae bacterium]
MRYGRYVSAEPFAGYTEFDELDMFEAETGAVNRTSPAYVRWVQSSLNRIMGLRLAVDGQSGAQTRSAVRSFQQSRGLQADGDVGPQTERALVAAGAGPPPAAGPALAPRSTPGLMKSETAPPSSTLYVDIALRSEGQARPMTGIFIPQGYRPQPPVDLILYLHGFKFTQAWKPYPTLSIDGYWDARQFPYFALRERLNESRKNVILVAPTLGARSEAGLLTRPGGFDAYLDQVMAALAAHGPYRNAGQPPGPGNIILACHSGGGLPMRQLALSNQRYTPQIKECWGFDSTYNRGDDTEWARWARSRPEVGVYIYYVAGSRTEALAVGLKRQKAPNVFVVPSPERRHNWVPLTHWRERIAAASFLRSV